MAEPIPETSKSTADESVTLGRYQLLERIGRGGMAEVFRARIDAAAGTEKVVCIKRILPHLSRNSDFTSLFIREAKVALPLSHGNITQVFDFGEVEQTYYLAMEYVHGQNLALVIERLREGGQTLDVPAALFVAAEVCRGLQYAHSYSAPGGSAAAVVHRDVSPHNVLISYHGEVKLTDFGIALAAARASEGDNVLRGKPCHVSPEQVEGRAVDARSDIFALGTVLYEMLTGTRVFEGGTDAETLQRVCTQEVPPPSQTNPDLDGEIDEIVLRALHKDPAKRHQRAGDLQVELTRVLHQRAHDFTAGKLSGLVKDLFAWELEAEKGAGDAARDRLLFQLSRAGVAVDGAGATTDELLQMHTVAIDGGGRPVTTRRARLWPWVATGGVLTVAAIVGAVLALTGPSVGTTDTDARPSLADLPRSDPTEHLLPASLREPRKAANSAAQATAGTATAKTQSGATQAPTVGKQRSPRSARDNEVAYVNCNSWPWSLVYLDGKRLRGNTPLYQVEVTPGRHLLRFVNPELRLSKEVTVVVAAGDIKTVAVKLQASAERAMGAASSPGSE